MAKACTSASMLAIGLAGPCASSSGLSAKAASAAPPKNAMAREGTDVLRHSLRWVRAEHAWGAFSDVNGVSSGRILSLPYEQAFNPPDVFESGEFLPAACECAPQSPGRSAGSICGPPDFREGRSCP